MLLLLSLLLLLLSVVVGVVDLAVVDLAVAVDAVDVVDVAADAVNYCCCSRPASGASLLKNEKPIKTKKNMKRISH